MVKIKVEKEAFEGIILELAEAKGVIPTDFKASSFAQANIVSDTEYTQTLQDQLKDLFTKIKDNLRSDGTVDGKLYQLDTDLNNYVKTSKPLIIRAVNKMYDEGVSRANVKGDEVTPIKQANQLWIDNIIAQQQDAIQDIANTLRGRFRNIIRVNGIRGQYGNPKTPSKS